MLTTIAHTIQIADGPAAIGDKVFSIEMPGTVAAVTIDDIVCDDEIPFAVGWFAVCDHRTIDARHLYRSEKLAITWAIDAVRNRRSANLSSIRTADEQLERPRGQLQRMEAAK